jgi:hypothetical protein
LKRQADSWHEVDPSDPIRAAAVRFLRGRCAAPMSRLVSLAATVLLAQTADVA